jgi:hypothetical protein
MKALISILLSGLTCSIIWYRIATAARTTDAWTDARLRHIAKHGEQYEACRKETQGLHEAAGNELF